MIMLLAPHVMIEC